MSGGKKDFSGLKSEKNIIHECMMYQPSDVRVDHRGERNIIHNVLDAVTLLRRIAANLILFSLPFLHEEMLFAASRGRLHRGSAY